AVEQTIAAGKIREHLLTLAAGRYLAITMEQRGVDLRATLTGPLGDRLAEEELAEWSGVKLLALVTPEAGVYRLTVSARPGAAGTYRLRIAELRPAVTGDGARVAAQRAFSVGRRLGREDTAAATRRSLAKLGEAVALFRRAGDARGEVDALNESGGRHTELGEAREAIPLCERALALARQAHYEPGAARALNNVGLARASLGQTDAALAAYRQALALWERLGDPAEKGRTLHNTAVLYIDLGQADQALDLLTRSLPLRHAAGDPGAEASTLNSMGGVYLWNLGEIDRALDALQRALALCRAAGDRRTEASVLNNLAAVYRRRGDLEKALSTYGEAFRLNRQLGDPASEAKVLHAAGNLYLELGDLPKAQEDYGRAFALYTAAGSLDFQANLISTIGWVYQLQGNPGEALAHYARALDLSRRTKSPRVEALALHRIGVARLALGQLNDARVSLQRALALEQAGRDRSEEARTRLELGSVLGASGEMAGANGQFAQALELSRQVEDSSIEADCLLHQARLARDEGDLERARERIEAALSIIESVRNNVTTHQLRLSFFSTKRAYYELYIDVLLRLERQAPGQGHLAAALAASERARARGLLDLLAEGRVDVRSGIAPELKRREEEIADRLSRSQYQLGRELARGSGRPGRVDALRRELAEAEGDQQALELEIRRRHPKYAEVRYPVPSQLAEIQQLLDGRTALLEFALGNDRSDLFVITRERLAAYPLPRAARIAGLVQSLRAALETPGRRLRDPYLKAAGELYDELLAPALPPLAGKSRLLIAPDRDLYLLPFEVLLTAPGAGLPYRDLPFLLRRYAIAYVPSASVLAGLREPRSEPVAQGDRKLLVAYGDPLYDEAAGGELALSSTERGARGTTTPTPVRARWELSRLAQSGREVLGVAGLYRPREVAVYLRQRATEENVKNNPLLRAARRLHFATHGLLYESRPQFSGLVLTRSGKEDGILRVYEIFNLKLSSDLVVLSACETGLGQEVTGEGIVGLSRAFLYAGTPSVLVSLWDVADASTPELMVNLYRGLDVLQEKAEALRQAKLEMIASGPYAHPFYWAPFVLIGEPR
ncbi:MAG TPA: CHAT domain-containing protein, partial [Thermoanaerobaculia bacterium]|nr:CHAT domain-containing protein [Thermoanaerobaculia bacterium]